MIFMLKTSSYAILGSLFFCRIPYTLRLSLKPFHFWPGSVESGAINLHKVTEQTTPWGTDSYSRHSYAVERVALWTLEMDKDAEYLDRKPWDGLKTNKIKGMQQDRKVQAIWC